jgi:hypothetical protein
VYVTLEDFDLTPEEGRKIFHKVNTRMRPQTLDGKENSIGNNFEECEED